MSIDNELEKRARLLAAQQEKKKASLDREALDLQAQSAKKTEESKIAGAAHERLLDFSPRLGGDVICPDCHILRKTVARLEASRARFIATGDGTFNELRCPECGYKLTVSGWG